MAFAVIFTGVSPSAHADVPTTIQLPNGFRPDGIATGSGNVAYFGSLANGAIFRVDLTTGSGDLLSAGTGGMATGLKVGPRNRLYVSGGSVGDGRIVDASTGQVLATYPLALAL